ncbi:MAG: response regulator [Cyclobacteriaceae bacterium]
MKIKVLIVEDNPLTAQDLSEVITEQGMTVCAMAKNRQEAIDGYEKCDPDILLVDINLKDGDDGVEFIKELAPKLKIPVVYLTANSDKETVNRAFSTKPASFLTKPYDDKDVIIALELAFNNHCNDVIINNFPSTSFIFLKNGTRFEKVNIESINYLQAEGSYSKFVTSTKEYFLSGNLHTISGKLKNPAFLRVHRSYVVNIDNITGLDSDYVFIGEKNIPISRSYKEGVNKVLRKIS